MNRKKLIDVTASLERNYLYLEKKRYTKNRSVCKIFCRDTGVVWELHAPTDRLLVPVINLPWLREKLLKRICKGKRPSAESPNNYCRCSKAALRTRSRSISAAITELGKSNSSRTPQARQRGLTVKSQSLSITFRNKTSLPLFYSSLTREADKALTSSCY